MVQKRGGSLLIAATVGTHLVSSTVIGVLIGYGLDRWLATAPFLTIVFFLLGVVAGFRSVFMTVRRLSGK